MGVGGILSSENRLINEVMDKKGKKTPIIYNVYVICMAIALPLHVFNMGGGEGLKPFHIPAAIACVLSFIFLKKKEKLYKIVIWFLEVALLSSLLSYASSAFSIWLNTFIILTSCVGLAYVESKQVVKYATLLIPIDVVVLYYHSLVEPQYRYQGFYSDPNYLCTTLIVFIFLLLIAYPNTEKITFKAIIIGTLVLSYALILLTLSRTGLLCSLLVLLLASIAAIKKHFLKLVIAALLGVWAIQHYATNFLDNQWDFMYERVFEADDNVEAAGAHRFELSMQNINFIIDNPQYIPFGLGGGTTNGKNASQIPGLSNYRKDGRIDHNTWTSIFSEQGLFCFILFFVIVYMTLKNVWRKENGTNKYLMLGVFLSIVLFSFSVSQKTYLPFWWIIFFLNNKTLINFEKEWK